MIEQNKLAKIKKNLLALGIVLDGLDVGVTTVNTGVSILVVDTHSQAVITKSGIDYSSNDSHINVHSIARLHKYCNIIAEGRLPNVLQLS